MSQRHILTAKEIDRAVPRAKAHKLNDGARLYINVSPSGLSLSGSITRSRNLNRRCRPQKYID